MIKSPRHFQREVGEPDSGAASRMRAMAYTTLSSSSMVFFISMWQSCSSNILRKLFGSTLVLNRRIVKNLLMAVNLGLLQKASYLQVPDLVALIALCSGATTPHQLSTHFWAGIKQAANTSQIKGFPPDSTLFGLLPYNDPCTSYIKLGCSPPPFPAS